MCSLFPGPLEPYVENNRIIGYNERTSFFLSGIGHRANV